MKTFLLLFCVALFVLAMVLLATDQLWLGVVAIFSAVICIMGHCLMEKEDELIRERVARIEREIREVHVRPVIRVRV